MGAFPQLDTGDGWKDDLERKFADQKTSGSYHKHGEASKRALEMRGLLLTDLDEEMTETTPTGKDAQAEDVVMRDSFENYEIYPDVRAHAVQSSNLVLRVRRPMRVS